jgi:hypothetical protein
MVIDSRLDLRWLRSVASRLRRSICSSSCAIRQRIRLIQTRCPPMVHRGSLVVLLYLDTLQFDLSRQDQWSTPMEIDKSCRSSGRALLVAAGYQEEYSAPSSRHNNHSRPRNRVLYRNRIDNLGFLYSKVLQSERQKGFIFLLLACCYEEGG